MSARKSSPSGWKLFVVRVWLPILVVVAWWLVSERSESLYFPPLREILESLFNEWVVGPRWRTDLLPSLKNFSIGFGVSVVLGSVLGVLLGMSQVMRALFAPVLAFFRALPSPALIPIVLGIFGIGASMNISLIVLGALWPTLLNTIDGVRSVDPQLRDVSKSYRLSRWQVITRIILPNASPQMFSGFRISLQLSIILIVISEMVGATRGLGYFVLESQQLFKIVQTWVGTILLGLLGYLVTLIFVKLEQRVLRWQVRMNTTQRNG